MGGQTPGAVGQLPQNPFVSNMKDPAPKNMGRWNDMAYAGTPYKGPAAYGSARFMPQRPVGMQQDPLTQVRGGVGGGIPQPPSMPPFIPSVPPQQNPMTYGQRQQQLGRPGLNQANPQGNMVAGGSPGFDMGGGRPIQYMNQPAPQPAPQAAPQWDRQFHAPKNGITTPSPDFGPTQAQLAQQEAARQAAAQQAAQRAAQQAAAQQAAQQQAAQQAAQQKIAQQRAAEQQAAQERAAQLAAQQRAAQARQLAVQQRGVDAPRQSMQQPQVQRPMPQVQRPMPQVQRPMPQRPAAPVLPAVAQQQSRGGAVRGTTQTRTAGRRNNMR